MNRRTLIIATLVLGTTAGAGLWAAQRFGSRESPVSDRSFLLASASAATTLERENRDQQIAFFEKRAREDPFSAGDRAQLAYLFLQRARETGSYQDVLRAEEAARTSLALRTAHNTSTYLLLSASLLEQHRFREANEAARLLFESDPENPGYRAHLGETQMELGDYDAARVTFGSLEPARKSLDVAPALARWEEIVGRTGEARLLLEAARDQAVKRSDLNREQVAWFHLRVGDLELRNGRLKQAERALRAGLELNPGDYRLLAAMARLEAVRGRWNQAVEYGNDAIAVAFDPNTVGLIAEAQAALGDSAAAREYLVAMDVATSSRDEPFHRPYGLFLLDHGRRIPEVAAKAAEEIETRRDVYGYDLLAWALHKQGRHAEAKAAMDSALRMGTQDALLFFHAGMIARALGDNAAARQHLRKALAINPYFHPTHPRLARATLKSLPKGS
ncbi:hypothetical protein BH24GEM2_BH24GEM2_14300 [soil metagenome]|jgi:tetratricopeptide (TPR) repeat protein